jgi:hypothetical protein
MQQNRGRNIHITTDNGRSRGSSSRSDSKYGESEGVEYQLRKNYKTTGVTCVWLLLLLLYHHHKQHQQPYHNKKLISSEQYCLGLLTCTTGRTYQVQFFFVRSILPGGNDKILHQGCPACSRKWPQPLSRAGSRAGHVIVISVIRSFVNYFVFLQYIYNFRK